MRACVRGSRKTLGIESSTRLIQKCIIGFLFLSLTRLTLPTPPRSISTIQTKPRLEFDTSHIRLLLIHQIIIQINKCVSRFRSTQILTCLCISMFYTNHLQVDSQNSFSFLELSIMDGLGFRDLESLTKVM